MLTSPLLFHSQNMICLYAALQGLYLNNNTLSGRIHEGWQLPESLQVNM